VTSRLARLLLLALLLASILLASPQLLLLTALLALVAGASALWGRYCLAGVSYARRFDAVRLFCGERLELWIEVVNAKPLPLAWLKAEDEFPEDFTVDRVELSSAGKPRRRILTNLLSLRWYERVRRRYRLRAERRGCFEFGPVTLSSGDIFGFRTRQRPVPALQEVIVYPRVASLERLGLRAARPGGEWLAERRVVEDPLRLAGARAYAPGDSLRHIHWKSTAHHQALQTKTFEPGASHHLIIALNGQTLEHAYEGVMRDYFETVIMVAASLANAGLEARRPVGLMTNSGMRGEGPRVRVPAARHPGQLTRLLEVMARLTHFTLMPFDRLLQLEAANLPFGASVIAVSALATEAIQAALLSLRDAGHPVALALVAEPGRVPVAALPASIPVYPVTQSWRDIEALELD
jgi:uncharacterized protein (DUF58 family)